MQCRRAKAFAPPSRETVHVRNQSQETETRLYLNTHLDERWKFRGILSVGVFCVPVHFGSAFIWLHLSPAFYLSSSLVNEYYPHFILGLQLLRALQIPPVGAVALPRRLWASWSAWFQLVFPAGNVTVNRLNPRAKWMHGVVEVRATCSIT